MYSKSDRTSPFSTKKVASRKGSEARLSFRCYQKYLCERISIVKFLLRDFFPRTTRREFLPMKEIRETRMQRKISVVSRLRSINRENRNASIGFSLHPWRCEKLFSQSLTSIWRSSPRNFVHDIPRPSAKVRTRRFRSNCTRYMKMIRENYRSWIGEDTFEK